MQYNKLGIKQRKSLFVTAFLAPGVILYLLIYAYPIINIFLTSFTNWNFKNLAHPEFIGFAHLFDNYKALFTTDFYYVTALKNSIKWIILAGVIQVPFALIVALVLSKKLPLWKFTRNVFIIPNIISSAAIGLIFVNMYDPAGGVITLLLEKLTGKDLNLLASPSSAFWCVTFAFVLFGGMIMLLMLSQISSISGELYEAASIDGATKFQQDLKITLPMMKSSLGTSYILACNYGLLIYNEIYLITKGGPDGSTYSIGYYIYKTAMGSSKLNFAKANTAGVIMILLGLTLVSLLSVLFSRRVDE
ncbi:MAG: sugar ABC transporter permease [Spirochaetales bacterium]|jgi:raffinose/stachyose/melibiose transport system permease protein|nr:sugar ABC transporter permease [Spirochaetales bacterium]